MQPSKRQRISVSQSLEEKRLRKLVESNDHKTITLSHGVFSQGLINKYLIHAAYNKQLPMASALIAIGANTRDTYFSYRDELFSALLMSGVTPSFALSIYSITNHFEDAYYVTTEAIGSFDHALAHQHHLLKLIKRYTLDVLYMYKYFIKITWDSQNCLLYFLELLGTSICFRIKLFII